MTMEMNNKVLVIKVQGKINLSSPAISSDWNFPLCHGGNTLPALKSIQMIQLIKM